ncbi:MAG: DUF1917 domain-containing protein [Anaerolineae bacterium]|nr:DUF1917 domain-containing protein [Anaerolineae bacterium]
MNQPEKPNLDLINQVQQARMQHDADAVPSQVSGVYWIEAKRSAAFQASGPTPRAGYWRIDTTLDQVDELWATIKAATAAGQLGYKSKVATASRDAYANSRVIHVLTYDHMDQADVDRVRAALEQLDIPGDLTYHAD